MKKILVFLLAVVMCLSFCACKKNENPPQTGNTQTVAPCSDQQIRLLMEQNLNYYYLFYVDPLEITGSTDSDKYGVADTSYVADYNALKDMINSTYVSEKATQLLNYPSSDTPLYKEKNGKLYVNPGVATSVEYNVIWDPDVYEVKILSSSETECTFELVGETFDGESYKTSGSAVVQNGKWLLTDVIH